MDFLFDSCSQYNLPEENGNKLPFWTYIPLRAIGICVCSVGAIVLPIHDIYRSLANMQCFEDRLIYFLVLNAVSKYCCVVFCLCQTIFLLRFKTKSSKGLSLRLLMSTIVAANVTLCINVVLSIKLAEDTVDFQTQPISRYKTLQINLEKKPLFVACESNNPKVDYVAEWIYRFTYQFPTEFMVLSLCYFGALWNIFSPAKSGTQSRQKLKQSRSVPMSRIDVDDENVNNLRIRRSPLIKTSKRKFRSFLLVAVKGTGVFISTWTFPLAFVIICGIFVLILYNEITYMSTFEDINILVYNRSSNATNMKNYYAAIQTVYHYTFCVVAPATWIFAARKERITHKRLNSSDILLLIATTGHVIFVMFETVDFAEVVFDNRSDAIAVIFFVKMILKYQGLLGEAMVVLIASKMEITRDSIRSTRQLAIKVVVVFLGVFNMERWFTDNFLPPNVIRYVEDIKYKEMYGEKTWWLLTAYLYPFVIIFRVAMVIMCFETCVRIKRETLKDTPNNLISPIDDMSQ